MQLAAIKVPLVDGRDLCLAACGWREITCDLNHLCIVTVQPGNGIAALGLGGLLLEAEDFALGVKLHDAVALGIMDRIPEHGRAGCIAQGAV